MNVLPAAGAALILGAGWKALAPHGALGVRSPRRATGGRSNVGGRMLGLASRRPARDPGFARWASRSDLRPLVVKAPERGRLSLGRIGRRLIAADPGSSVLVVGPTQSRKTSGLAIPAVLEWDGPVVAASVKSDLARHTIDWRTGLGQVWVYDPTASTTLRGTSWSPLGQAQTWAGARRVARSLTDVARASGGGPNDADFWYATATKLLAPLLLAAAVSERTTSDVVRWLDYQEIDEVAGVLEAAGEWEALQAARATWERDERQRSAVYTTAETVVEAFADPVVADSSGRPAWVAGSIDPAKLIEDTNTLYLCAPAHDQRRFRPLFATLVTQVIEAAYERAERQAQRLDPPLLVVLDEAANVAPIAELDVLASTAAGHGVQLVTVWQDLGQLTSRYGSRSQSVVNNHRAKVFLSGISDPQTLEHASQLVGESEHSTISRTFDGRQSASTTESHVTRRLLPPDALRRVRPGSAVLVSGHLPPVRISLRPWHEDAVLRRRGNGPAGPLASG